MRNRVQVHLSIHRRRQDDRTRRRKRDDRYHIIGQPLCELCNRVCRCRCDNQNISPVGKIDMLRADIGFRRLVDGPQIRKNRVSGKRRKRERSDKTRRCFGHHDFDIGSRFHKLPHEVCGFICGNSARNTDKNMFAVEARHGYSSAGVSLVSFASLVRKSIGSL